MLPFVMVPDGATITMRPNRQVNRNWLALLPPSACHLTVISIL